jgi:hypothetical protein
MSKLFYIWVKGNAAIGIGPYRFVKLWDLVWSEDQINVQIVLSAAVHVNSKELARKGNLPVPSSCHHDCDSGGHKHDVASASSALSSQARVLLHCNICSNVHIIQTFQMKEEMHTG